MVVQLFVINGNSVVLNGETLFTVNLANSFAVTPDLQCIYVASAYNVEKYVKKFNVTTGEITWETDNTFSFVFIDNSQFISGLLLRGKFLYVSTANSKNISYIINFINEL